MNTAASIPIESFSIDEKLILMERLWSDLSGSPTQIPTPEWHGNVLADRLAEARGENDAFLDWQDVKNRLRERLK